MKTKLLVTEFWGLGDLAIASRFLSAASENYQLLLVAKPYAADLAKTLWPQATVKPFTAPWTKFRGKYRLHQWPWRELTALRRTMREFSPEIALSARWDPRDHLVLFASGAPRRIGFPRTGSQLLLTESLPQVSHDAPRTAQWDALAQTLQLSLKPSPKACPLRSERIATIHSGAAQALRVWPLERYRDVIGHLKGQQWAVQVLCDHNQTAAWAELGIPAHAPQTPSELIESIRKGDLFIGNDSGPGHLAAALEVPTFTIFGPQRPEWFLPDHGAAGWVEGKPCPYKPCFDYCRFPVPSCIRDLTVDEVIQSLTDWLAKLDTGSQAPNP